MFLAISYLVAFSIPAYVAPISSSAQYSLDLFQWVIWVVFALDTATAYIRSDHKRTFAKKHTVEIASLFLPAIRPLRLLRLVSFSGLIIQKIAVGKQFAITMKVALFSVLTAYIAAVQITLLERESESANIRNIGDGLWWAMSTVTTVGYGDRYPTTSTGRVVALFLMLIGISLMGVITASVAAVFVKLSQSDSE